MKMLIVDDSPMDRALASGLIKRRMKCEILEASNGREGLERIERDHPDFVLSDLQMPEMNGLELVSIIKDRFPNIPVILMTAQGSEEIASQALHHGAASYVPKRRLADDLVATIERVLATAREERRQSVLMHHLAQTETRFILQNDPNVLPQLVSYLLDMLRCMPLGDETERLRVGIALEEGLNNAFYHGNMEVSANDGPRDRKSYENLAEQRSTESPYCDRKIDVHVWISPAEARFVIRDDGPGFAWKQHLDTQVAPSQQSYGRGIVLMRSSMDEVSYNEKGNEVTLVKRSVSISEEEVD
ncbi:MAG: response regulator [Schlesneria sp.]